MSQPLQGSRLAHKPYERPGRQRIIDAFVEILSEKDIEDITVKEIIRRADVHRSTYYYNFHKVDEILECVMERFLEGYRSGFEAVVTQGLSSDSEPPGEYAPTLGAIRHAYANRETFRLLATGSTSDLFRRRWIENSLDLFHSYDVVFRDAQGKVIADDPWEHEGMLRSMAYILYALLEHCANTSFKGEPEDLHALMGSVFGLSSAKTTIHARKPL